MRRPRGPRREIVRTEQVEGLRGVYREHLSCGHIHLDFDTPSPISNRRHCRDCRDGGDRFTRIAERVRAERDR